MGGAPEPAFAETWAASHLRAARALSPRRRRTAYACTYLTPATMRHLPSIVDAGCGSGAVRWYLRACGWHGRYVGCDASPASLAMANVHEPSRAYVRADLRRLPFADHAFALAYARDSLIHTPDPLDALAEVRRVATHMILRIRIAEVPTCYTARYAHSEALHHWVNLPWFLTRLAERGQAAQVRYRVQAGQRAVVPGVFRDPVPFTHYAAADLLVIGRAAAPCAVIADPQTRLGAWWRQVRNVDYLRWR